MAWEPRLIIYTPGGFCCAAALSIGAWMCSNVCVCVCVFVCVCVCVCGYMSILPLPSSQQEPGFLKKTHIKRRWDLLCVCECKSQCLRSCAVSPQGVGFKFFFFECTFSGLEVCARLARAHVCQGVSMCLIVSLHESAWAAACDSQGSVVPFWSRQQRGETDYLSVPRRQKSALRLTNLASRFNILLISPANTGATRSCTGRWIGFVCEYNAK